MFVDLYRKNRELEDLNRELEFRVAERTSELVEAIKRFRESENRLRLASEAAGFGTYVLNQTTEPFYCSPELKRLLGTKVEGDHTIRCLSRSCSPGGSRYRTALSVRSSALGLEAARIRFPHPRRDIVTMDPGSGCVTSQRRERHFGSALDGNYNRHHKPKAGRRTSSPANC